jgi:hypothetical protein
MVKEDKPKKPRKKVIKLDFGDIYPYSAKLDVTIPHDPKGSSLASMVIRDDIIGNIADRIIKLTREGFLNYAFINHYNYEVYFCNQNTLYEKGYEKVPKHLKDSLFFSKRLFFQSEGDLNSFLLIFHEHFKKDVY